MNGEGPHYHGRSEGPDKSLEKALKDAWDQATKDHADPGVYDVDIKIETTNPIHAYIVILTPSG